LADLKRSIRASLCYFQTVRQRLQTLIATWGYDRMLLMAV